MIFKRLQLLTLVFSALLFASEPSEMRYLVDPLLIQYYTPHPNLPPISEILKLKVALSETELGYEAPSQTGERVNLTLSEMGSPGKSLWFYQSALMAIGSDIVQYFNDKGIYGVRVAIGPQEIDADGDDLRPTSDTALHLYILQAEIGPVHTKVRDQDESVDLKRHQMIRECAPIKPDNRELLAPQELQEYLFFLNRYPNRNIDVQISSTDGMGLVGIDFIIDESKPWRLYLNVANTGPQGLNSMQESVGFIHTQVTGHDDIFQIDASTDSFNQFQSVIAYYERPFLSNPRLRWRLEGDEARFSSAQLSFEDEEFVGSRYGAKFLMRWNGYQKKDFFIDLVGAAQYRYISVNNHLRREKGHEDFVLPQLGLEMSRIRRTSLFYLGLLYFMPINGITGVKQSNLDKLGRLDVNKQWEILEGEANLSFYLEAIGESPYKRLANEIFLYAQGQTSFGNRLIPEYQAVLGGLYSVRGYPTAIVAADSAITSVFEYRLHLPQLFTPLEESPKVKLFGKPFRVRPPYPGGAADWDLILRGFFDLAAIHNVQASDPSIPRDPEVTLMGTGVGAELILRQNLFLRFDNGWALKEVENISKGHYEFYFSGTVVY